LGIDSRYYMNNFIFLIISQIKIFWQIQSRALSQHIISGLWTER
jgi:hypothetical protein